MQFKQGRCATENRAVTWVQKSIFPQGPSPIG
jgi:hypothetical protein